ncbi:MAG: hypothetical protein K2R98_15760 [Gemmataceae bacterium]|nr:hypothetical protein [Gemmataceae bacterium]
MWGQLSASLMNLQLPEGSELLVGILFAVALFLGGRFLMGRLALDAPTPRSSVSPRRTREEPIPARRRASPVGVFLRGAQSQPEPFLARVVDRSINGLSIELDEKPGVPLGAVLTVRPCSAAEEFPWVEVRMQEIRHHKGTWELECPFVHVPPWSVRMFFG